MAKWLIEVIIYFLVIYSWLKKYSDFILEFLLFIAVESKTVILSFATNLSKYAVCFHQVLIKVIYIPKE